ncbi:putative protein-synthesizing GTPase [Helianthus debilis subsp. tardiflorus]
MATMLNGAAIMDGALLLIAANESSLQPQTFEHLAAVRGEGFKGRGGAPDPPNFSASSVIYVRFV